MKLEKLIAFFIRNHIRRREKSWARAGRLAVECLKITTQYRTGNPSFEIAVADLDQLIRKVENYP